jgi:hypothetical protein
VLLHQPTGVCLKLLQVVIITLDLILKSRTG